jgi:predicted Zn-dependent peptidase
MDAFTTKEHTCFYVQVLDEHLPLAVDLLTDVLLRPRFDADELEREKSVVLQEIKMVEDTPDDLIHDLFSAHVWAGHPLGRPILGSREAVEGYGRDIVHAHFVEHYVPAKIIIAVAGNVTHERAVQLFSADFNGFTLPPAEGMSPSPVMRAGVNIVHKPLEQVHLVMGFPGLSHGAPERYALYLLNDIVGGSMSSRLFQEVRERQGLVYSIHSGVQPFRDTGLPTSMRPPTARTSPKCSRPCSRSCGASRRMACRWMSSSGPRTTSRAASCSRSSPPRAG